MQRRKLKNSLAATAAAIVVAGTAGSGIADAKPDPWDPWQPGPGHGSDRGDHGERYDRHDRPRDIQRGWDDWGDRDWYRAYDRQPPWGWGPPPRAAWRGVIPPPWGPPPPPFNYWGNTVYPIWDPGYNAWGFWLFGIFIPLVAIV